MTTALVRQQDGQAPPLLLLPPLGSDQRFFAPLVENLDNEVWTADVHAGPETPTIADVADRLSAALEETAPGPVAVIGVSLGGLVAQHLAADHTADVSHLVLADTLVSYPDPMRRMWEQRATHVESAGTVPVLGATLDTWFGSARSEATATLQQSCVEMVRSTDPSAYAATCRALQHADTTRLLDAIRAPTLVLCGDQDGPAFLAGAEDLAGRLSPDGGVAWLQGAHHAALLEQPQLAATLIRDHVRTEQT